MNEQSSQRLLFYATPSAPCSYLDGKVSRSAFLDPQHTLTNNRYYQLNRLGFRRSGNHIYRPWCKDCNACKSVRLMNYKINYRPLEYFNGTEWQHLTKELAKNI